MEYQLFPNEVLELLLTAGESELWKVDLGSGDWGWQTLPEATGH